MHIPSHGGLELCQNAFKTDMTAVNLLNLQESACNCLFLLHLSFCQLNLFKIKSESKENVDWLGGLMAEEGNSHQPLELPLQWEMSALSLWLIQASCGVSPVLFIAVNVLSLFVVLLSRNCFMAYKHICAIVFVI